MIVERIVYYLKEKGIAVSAFERDLGLGNTTISRAYKAGGAIGTDKLEKIISHCKDLSPLWLVTGEGDMLIGESSQCLTPTAQNEKPTIEVSVVKSAGAVIISDVKSLENMIHDAVSKAMGGK